MIEVVDIGQPELVQRRRRLPRAGTYLGAIPRSVQVRRRLPGAGTFVSGADDRIMMLEAFRGRLGLLPGGRTLDPTPQKIADPGRIIDGPQVQIGPFLFSADREGPFSFSASWDLYRQRVDLQELFIDSFRQVDAMGRRAAPQSGPHGTSADFSQRWVAIEAGCLVSWGIGTDNFVPRTGSDDRRIHPDIPWYEVPCDAVWAIASMSGDEPIWKFKHPKNGQDWGVFFEVDKNGVTWTFKKREPGLWGTLWGWLEDLAAMLVSFIQDVFRALKAAACLAAKVQLEKLAVSAETKVQLSAGDAADLSIKTGLGINALNSIVSNPTSDLARSIGGSVIAAFCKGDGKPPSPGPTEEPEKKSIILPVLLVGGAATALVLLT